MLGLASRRRVITAMAVAVGCTVLPTRIHAQHTAQGNSRQQTPLAEIDGAVVRVVGSGNGAAEYHLTGHVLVVRRVNSNLNNAQSAERDSEAAAIRTAIAPVISQNPAFKRIVSIRIEYVAHSKDGRARRTVDTIEFRKDPKGHFVRHVS